MSHVVTELSDELLNETIGKVTVLNSGGLVLTMHSGKKLTITMYGDKVMAEISKTVVQKNSWVCKC